MPVPSTDIQKPLKLLLGNSRQALQRQLQSVPIPEQTELLKRFDTRGQALLQKGMAMTPERIQADIQRLLNFKPEESLPEGIKTLLDKLLSVFVPEFRGKVKRIIGLVFFMGTMKQLPIFGPLIGATMDIVSGYLPVLASTVQTVVPNMVGMLPIPYAAFAGEAVAYAVSSVMMFFNIMTTASEGEFAEAAETIVGLVPILGPNLMNYLSKGKNIYAKLEENKEAILTSIEEIRGIMLFFLPTVVQFVGKKNILDTLNTVSSFTKSVVSQAETRMIDGKMAGGHRKKKRAQRARTPKRKCEKKTRRRVRKRTD